MKFLFYNTLGVSTLVSDAKTYEAICCIDKHFDEERILWKNNIKNPMYNEEEILQEYHAKYEELLEKENS